MTPVYILCLFLVCADPERGDSVGLTFRRYFVLRKTRTVSGTLREGEPGSLFRLSLWNWRPPSTQQAPLSPRDHTTRYVSWSLVNCCTTARKTIWTGLQSISDLEGHSRS